MIVYVHLHSKKAEGREEGERELKKGEGSRAENTQREGPSPPLASDSEVSRCTRAPPHERHSDDITKETPVATRKIPLSFFFDWKKGGESSDAHTRCVFISFPFIVLLERKIKVQRLLCCFCAEPHVLVSMCIWQTINAALIVRCSGTGRTESVLCNVRAQKSISFEPKHLLLSHSAITDARVSVLHHALLAPQRCAARHWRW
jgi:hypothetical protein